MSENIQLRQSKEATDTQRAQYESPDAGERQQVCTMVAADSISEQLGEFAELTVSEEADVQATIDRETTNYGVYETPGGAIEGLYISAETLEAIFGETDEAPESVGLSFAPSDEDAFEAEADQREEDSVDEEEVEALVGGESDESDDEPEEVEVDDEAVGLVESDD